MLSNIVSYFNKENKNKTIQSLVSTELTFREIIHNSAWERTDASVANTTMTATELTQVAWLDVVCKPTST